MKKSSSAAINKIFNKTAQNVARKMSGSNSLLYNKYLLYASFIVAFINILLWLSNGDYFHVIVFFLVGYLTYQFSKNMMVVLVISFVISNIVKSGSTIVLEGMEDKKKEGIDDDDSGKAAKKKVKKEGMGKKEGMVKKEGMSKQEGIEQYEGLDDEEDQEGMDADADTPCTNDFDCKNGNVCDTDRFICTAKK